jgi:hypothetical protein
MSVRWLPILFLGLVGLNTAAQVKELNILKHPIKLHGIELRLGFPNLQHNNIQELDDLHTQLASVLRSAYNLGEPTQAGFYPYKHSRLDNSLELGIVFKPKYTSNNYLLRNLELRHALGYNESQYFFSWDTIQEGRFLVPYGSDYFEQNVYYGLSANTSSKVLFNHLKVYGGADVRIGKSLYSEYGISRNSASIVYDIDPSIINPDENQKDYFSLNNRSLGLGYTAGIKVYLSCYLNLHIEFRELWIHQQFAQTNNSHVLKNSQFLVGLRYKFSPLLAKSSQNPKTQSAFW